MMAKAFFWRAKFPSVSTPRPPSLWAPGMSDSETAGVLD